MADARCLLLALSLVGLLLGSVAAADDPDPATAAGIDPAALCETFGGPSCATSTQVEGLNEPCTCKDKSQDYCECVFFYQCDNSTGEYDEDGIGLLDIRKSDGCPAVETKCCKIKGDDRDHEKRSPQPHPDFPLPKPPATDSKCGVLNAGGVASKVVNNLGGETGFGEFPWMVAILARGRNKAERFACGGALVKDNVVLTAAHCVKGLRADALRVRAGEWDREATTELYKHQDRGVREVVIHDQFYSGNYRFDAALLLLDKPVELGYHVGTVCLPERDAVFDDERCIVTGWGKDKLEDKWPHRYLKRVDLSVVRDADCEDRLRASALGDSFKLHHTHLCAGGEEGKDTCKGDGGSPLVCPRSDGLYQVAGIVAWGVNCGRPGLPGIYTRVTEIRPWIDGLLESN